jgi:hypothetical protein
MLSIFLNEGHLTRWRGNALALIGDGEAVDNLYAALETTDPTFVRASAGLHCDLAQAHLARGEHDQARSTCGKPVSWRAGPSQYVTGAG